MKYIEKPLNSDQQRYEKMIKKLDPEVNPHFIKVRVPETSELEQKYAEEMRRASNNFEKKKLEIELQLKQIVWRRLGQVQFETTSLGFKYPIYFEIVPRATPEGTILEGTLNTLVNRMPYPCFFGRIFNQARGYFSYFLSPGVGLKEDMFEGLFDLVKYRDGEFSVAQLLSDLKFNMGPKFIEMEAYGKEPFEDKLMESIIKDRQVMESLINLHYCSEQQFEPVDLPKNRLRFGFLQTECVGCILPASENTSILQFGDFNVITKSPLFPLVKRVVSIIHTFTPR